jgi:hypothetical protein
MDNARLRIEFERLAERYPDLQQAIVLEVPANLFAPNDAAGFAVRFAQAASQATAVHCAMEIAAGTTAWNVMLRREYVPGGHDPVYLGAFREYVELSRQAGQLPGLKTFSAVEGTPKIPIFAGTGRMQYRLDGAMITSQTDEPHRYFDWWQHIVASHANEPTYHEVVATSGRIIFAVHSLRLNVFRASAMALRTLIPESKPAVLLRGAAQKPVVCGKEVDPISEPKYRVVAALLAAGPDGLATEELTKVKGDAVKYLRDLRSSSRHWEKAIVMPGVAWGRYGIRHDS